MKEPAPQSDQETIQPPPRPAVADEVTESLLPRTSDQEALASLKLAPPDRSLLSIRVNRVSPYSAYSEVAPLGQSINIPFQARNQIVLRVRPGLSLGELRSMFDEFDVEPVDVAPAIGMVVVQLRRVDIAHDNVAMPMDALGEADVTRKATDFSRDQRVLAAAPNTVLSTNEVRLLTLGSGPRAITNGAAGELEDWGIGDAHISEMWPRLQGPFKVGVVDLGFATHNDLDLKNGLTREGGANYHGNFVAGILCGKHNNVGVRGVLKNCTVLYASSPQILSRYDRVEGNLQIEATAVTAYLSEYLLSTMRLIQAHPELTVINISLGYNWIANLNRNPATDEQLRDVVRNQGVMALGLLEFAAEKGVSIVSAAGNDSRGLAAPVDARWSSPFNHASHLMTREHGWSNGLVVEAHDRRGNRPPFSNTGGHISCPGVEIRSTVASPANWVGIDDGTSMAAPYCAGALVGLRHLIPTLKVREAINCLRRSDRQRDNVPILNLKYAVEHCTAAPQELRASNQPVDFKARVRLFSDPEPVMTASVSGCQYGMRKEFKTSPVVDLGDGQGPEFGEPGAREEVRQYVRSVIDRGCREPAFIVTRFGFDAESRSRQEFSQGIMREFFRASYPGGVAIIQWPLFGDFGDNENFTDRVVVMIGDTDFKNRLVGTGQ